MGDSLKTVNWERALAGSTGRATWLPHRLLGFSSAATGNSPPDISASAGRGLPPVTVIQASQRVRDYNLVWAALESVRIDVRDARMTWKFMENISSLYDLLQNAVSRAWTYQVREEFFRLCDFKILLGTPESGSQNAQADLTVVGPSSFATMLAYTAAQVNHTGGTISAGASDRHSILTGGVLDDLYARLNRRGAGVSPKMRGSGKPVYPLICSPETSMGLQKEPGTRSDIRWDDASPLLKSLGYDRSLKGYMHVLDDEVPRFTFADAGGSSFGFTEVLPWTQVAGSVSTAIASATSSGAPTGCYIATVTSSAAIVAGSIVTITASSASDEEVQGFRRVRSVPSATTVIIEDANFADTYAGTLTTQTNGEVAWEENSSYNTAPYEMSFIAHPDVMEILTMPDVTSLGHGAEFDAAKSLGDFKWMNVQDEIRNPDKTMGYFRAVLEEASKPKTTKFGIAIMHRRPDPTVLAAPSLSTISGLGYTQ
jgi:hypothetical protein